MRFQGVMRQPRWTCPSVADWRAGEVEKARDADGRWSGAGKADRVASDDRASSDDDDEADEDELARDEAARRGKAAADDRKGRRRESDIRAAAAAANDLKRAPAGANVSNNPKRIG